MKQILMEINYIFVNFVPVVVILSMAKDLLIKNVGYDISLSLF